MDTRYLLAQGKAGSVENSTFRNSSAILL